MKWLETVTTVAPENEPVSLEDAKAHLRVEASYTRDDTKIRGLIAGARADIEKYTGQRLPRQTVLMRADVFDEITVRLPTGPIASITSISYRDTAGELQTVSADDYDALLDGIEPLLVLKPGKAWPITAGTPGAIRIVAIAGAETIDPAIALAIKVKLEGLYDEPRAEDETVIANLLTNHRRGI